MKWLTPERPKIDRIACPWLIKNFVDKDAEIIYVRADKVKEQAAVLDAIPSTFRMLSFHTLKTNAP